MANSCTTRRLMVAGFYSQMVTLGGGDIRRQDMPFPYNRTNTSRAGAMGMVPMPFHPSLQVQFALAKTLTGRNVGESTTTEAQKEEASISRLYGGIQYRSDLEMGKAHGRRIGGYTVSFARTDGAQ